MYVYIAYICKHSKTLISEKNGQTFFEKNGQKDFGQTFSSNEMSYQNTTFLLRVSRKINAKAQHSFRSNVFTSVILSKKQNFFSFEKISKISTEYRYRCYFLKKVPSLLFLQSIGIDIVVLKGTFRVPSAHLYL